MSAHQGEQDGPRKEVELVSGETDGDMGQEDGDLGQMVAQLHEKMDKLNEKMHSGHIAEYVRLMNKPRKLFWKSLLSGIGRGVGIAIGLTVFLVSLLYFLRALGALDLPIIGDYIADIVEIVQNQLQLRSY